MSGRMKTIIMFLLGISALMFHSANAQTLQLAQQNCPTCEKQFNKFATIIFKKTSAGLQVHRFIIRPTNALSKIRNLGRVAKSGDWMFQLKNTSGRVLSQESIPNPIATDMEVFGKNGEPNRHVPVPANQPQAFTITLPWNDDMTTLEIQQSGASQAQAQIYRSTTAAMKAQAAQN